MKMSDGMLSQEEIDALLNQGLSEDSATETSIESASFSDLEKDAIGEIANISMGTAATTLALLLSRPVEITTPTVSIVDAEQVRKDYPIPSVIVNVQYKIGIDGNNLLILSQKDGSIIVDLMLGNDGENPPDELDEMRMSGISEAMNQMMGSSATAMSSMFKSMVDITPPTVTLHDFSTTDEPPKDFLPDGPLIRVSFRMVVGTLIDSTLVQIIPIDVAKGMVAKMLMHTVEYEPKATTPPPTSETPIPTVRGNEPASHIQPSSQQEYIATPSPKPTVQTQTISPQVKPIQPAQFAPLTPVAPVEVPDNLGLILDIPLQVSVELGKTKKTIKEILELGPGSVIELDRLAGEPVDMIVNGKLVAKCEVIVINETFGIRITDIIQPSERVKSLR